MAGPINLKLLTDFFNKIGQQRTNCQIYFPANPTCTKPTSQDSELSLTPRPVGDRSNRSADGSRDAMFSFGD